MSWFCWRLIPKVSAHLWRRPQFFFPLRSTFMEELVAIRMRSFFAVVFLLVFLSGNEATLSNSYVGDCRFLELFCDMRKCVTMFIKELQNDSVGDCGAKVNKTINCIRRTYNICFGTDYARHFESVRVQFTETSMCHEGALGLPTSHSLEVLAAHCPESFSTNLNNCLKSFQGTFARDKTDPDLCKEHAKATECVRKLFASTCPKLPTSYRELIDLTFIKNNYNPYCDNNRDPGASKIPDQCNGVRELDNPWTKLLKNNSTSNINNNSKSAHNITSNTITTPTDDIRREFVSCSPKHINAATGTSINTFQAFFFPCVVLQLFYTVWFNEVNFLETFGRSYTSNPHKQIPMVECVYLTG